MFLTVSQIIMVMVEFMYKYLLKTKSGEIISFTKQKSFDLAVEYFSKMKLLPKEDLFKIYIIEKE